MASPFKHHGDGCQHPHDFKPALELQRAAWLSANRISHSPFSGGGATRSLRLGIGVQAAGMGTGPPDTEAMGSASRRCRSGSAWTSAVAFQSHSE